MRGFRRALLEQANRLRREVADRRRIEEEMRRKNRELEAAATVKGDFLSMVSHELRTPLSVILGYTDLLLQGKYSEMPPVAQKPLGVIRRRARDLNRLVSDLLQLSALDRGTAKVEPRSVRVHRHLRELMTDFQSMALKKPTAFALDGEDFAVLADPTRLHQVVGNLLDNAIKYSSEQVDIRIETVKKDGRGFIRVSDNGIGIEADALPRIFERFYQSEKVHTREHGGAGLGLAIARETAHRMGGEITVASEPGKGSTFTVSLPLAPEKSEAG
jgi:signal transduction histidine kinase